MMSIVMSDETLGINKAMFDFFCVFSAPEEQFTLVIKGGKRFQLNVLIQTLNF